MLGLIERLSRLDSCAVSDALDNLQLPGTVIGIGPLTGPVRVAGSVMTIKLGPLLSGSPKSHLGCGAIMAATRGDIIVVEHHGCLDVAGWGGLLSRAARRRGVAAVIIDGACRDLDESRTLQLPIFARGAVPVTARGRISEHSFGELIVVGGVSVSPGDFVIADGSGVVFVGRAHIENVLRVAEEIAANEASLAAAIDRGEPVDQVMAGNYEYMLENLQVK